MSMSATSSQTQGGDRFGAASDVNRYAQHLPLSVVLEEMGPPHFAKGVIIAITALVVLFVGWSAIATFEEITVARGEVAPVASVMPVQHLEGGIVSEILVHNGQQVEPGQVLVRLDSTTPLGTLKRLRALYTALFLQAERQRAFALEKAPDYSNVGPKYADLVREQREILAVQNKARASQRAVAQAQIAERLSELDALGNEQKTLEKHLSLIKKELDLRQGLLKKGLTSRLVFLNTEREYNKAKGDLQEVISRQSQARSAIAEAEGRRLEADAQLRNAALAEMGALSTEMIQLREDITRLVDQVDRLQIRSPARGIVKGLAVTSTGRVIAPGAVLMEIVPTDEEMVAEVRIKPTEVGRVSVGSPVMVKVMSYDFARFGGIEGTLSRISASSFIDQRGEPYFKGIVSLSKSQVGNDPAHNRVLPGMTVTADIKTGQKTLLQYLIRPVYTALKSSFHEH